MVAILEIARDQEEYAALEILASPRVVDMLTTKRRKYEQDGYIGCKDKVLHQATVAALRKRKQTVRFKKIQNPARGSPEEKAGVLAITAAYEEEPKDLNLNIPAEMRLTGASLAEMTQAKAYREIKRRKKLKELASRTRTRDNLEKAKDEMEDACGHRPKDEQIWRSQKNKDLSKKQQAFMWMVTHDAYAVGSHWLRDSYNDEKRQRAECKHCGEMESMQHIFTRCESPGREQIWALAKELWQSKGHDWPWPGLGMIIASGCSRFTKDGRRDRSAERLHRILMIESAYLIWLLRNERVIQNDGAPHTEEEIRGRWVNAINARLKLDCALTCKKYGKNSLPANTVLGTWKGALKGEQALPEDWTGIGVLVGIEPRRHGGRVGGGREGG
ncbi:hypothetical protein C8F01DRAFT_982855 [Mycena amicta]|nr:hypothetical protein C8F01DRAFT_982855 [Mycena amicta]